MAIKPPMLQPGDTIGVVALGSPLDPNVINEGVQTLRSMGFRVLIGRYAYGQSGITAATDEQRAADLMDMFRNDDVKLILSTRGGTGVAGILPFLDYNFIRQHPKIVSGYSDVTILLNTLYALSNLVTFNSLLLLDFTSGTPSFNFNQFFAVTSTTTAPRPIENPPGIPFVSRIKGNVTGPIVGGNLASLVDSLGTPYEIDTRNKILYLEETHEPTNKVYRYLNHLKLAGKLDDSLGFVMGQCTECTVIYNTTYDDLINHFFVPLGKPLLTNLAGSHSYYKVAIPIGAVVTLNTEANILTIEEPTVTAGP
ncbi:S66 peptidase family protein [Tuberibacillus calidus]|jgi:muramoyltetrapeptide carboxypeptidase|uniref:S66 peptidase family protein n=1 Tax=Tuberibacillus calidus TaxID=340097 RepID=UPI000412418F|nr:LD-carboxypeptidase [Tuberibacillus calidus]